MKSINFSHPEPDKEHIKIVPFFIPFVGCPKRCIYCAQHIQSGTEIDSIEGVFSRFRKMLESLMGERGIELAFFGGTFTGLSKNWLQRFLSLSLDYKQRGIIKKIRCSTRPDFIDEEILGFIKEMGVDTVELGIQSFDDGVLISANRGYTSDVAKRACCLIKDMGLDLGIQLLPGLPGFSTKIWLKDIEVTSSFKPKFVRIYPCLVLKNTLLEKKYLKKEYTPLDLRRSIRLVARGVLKLWRNHIPVIRIGLHNESFLEKNIVAGPWSAGYGSMVRSYILYKIIVTYFLVMGRKIKEITMPKKYQGEVFGYRKQLKDKYKRLGIDKENIYFKEKEFFTIVFN